MSDNILYYLKDLFDGSSVAEGQSLGGSSWLKHHQIGNMVTHANTRRPPNDNGFTIVELIVTITVIGLLATLAVGAYNKVVSDAKIAKSKALISTLASAKSAFVSDPQTVAGSITAFNAAPDANFTLIAPYIRVNGAQPVSESDLLSLSGMPSGVTITLGTVDDSSLNGGHTDQSPTVTGYGL